MADFFMYLSDDALNSGFAGFLVTAKQPTIPGWTIPGMSSRCCNKKRPDTSIRIAQAASWWRDLRIQAFACQTRFNELELPLDSIYFITRGVTPELLIQSDVIASTSYTEVLVACSHALWSAMVALF